MQGPEIRTGFLKDGKPIQLKEGQEIIITTDYNIKGDPERISMSYQKLAVDLKPGNTILCADGTITLTVLSCDPKAGTVRCRCENTSMLGERKNVNLPGVVVDLPTLTEKDKEDILGWGVPNKIDMIALSFVRKGSDLVNVRKVLGPHAKNIMLMSKVCLVLSVQSWCWSVLKCTHILLICKNGQYDRISKLKLAFSLKKPNLLTVASYLTAYLGLVSINIRHSYYSLAMLAPMISLAYLSMHPLVCGCFALCVIEVGR